MYPLVLNECAEFVSMPLSLIFKKSLKSEKVSSAWKLVNITQIYKKDAKTDLANHSPFHYLQ